MRFDSEVPINQRPQRFDFGKQTKEIFDSAFFGIGQDMGVETSFNKESFSESINLNNALEELGFASVAIKTLEKAKHKVAMKLYIK